jgi:hypothetical protein
MLLLRTEKLPEGLDWLVELKLDGYRALAMKTAGKVQLRSRNDNDFSLWYHGIVKALQPMPDETVIDGEVIALDAEGRPSFNMLQNYGSEGSPLHYFIFDVLILNGKNVMGETLVKRRELIEEFVLPTLADPIRYSPILEGSLKDLATMHGRLPKLVYSRPRYDCCSHSRPLYGSNLPWNWRVSHLKSLGIHERRGQFMLPIAAKLCTKSQPLSF